MKILSWGLISCSIHWLEYWTCSPLGIYCYLNIYIYACFSMFSFAAPTIQMSRSLLQRCDLHTNLYWKQPFYKRLRLIDRKIWYPVLTPNCTCVGDFDVPRPDTCLHCLRHWGCNETNYPAHMRCVGCNCRCLPPCVKQGNVLLLTKQCTRLDANRACFWHVALTLTLFAL